MSIYQIVAVGIIGAILSITIKTYNPTFSVVVTLSVVVLIFLALIPQFLSIIGLVERINRHIEGASGYIAVIIQIIGISYIAEIGANLCNDAGETAIASKVELAAKIIILGLAAPIIIDLIDMIVRIV